MFFFSLKNLVFFVILIETDDVSMWYYKCLGFS